MPYISDRLAETLANPIRFVRPGRGGKTAIGYEATLLVDICNMVLQARKEGQLPEKDMALADRCEILMMGFATVGIIALVDEATGYQEERARDALHQILEAYIAKELLPWAKRFPDEFYKEIFRLWEWQYNPDSVKRTPFVGKLTENIVYKRLPPGVLEELKRLNPKNEKGRRKHKHHQILTENIGNPHLEKHIVAVVALMRASKDWKMFEELLQRAFPVANEQLYLGISDVSSN